MRGPFLIPANSKKGQLILGVFRFFDLILFISGIFISFFLILIFQPDVLWEMLIVFAPGLIATFLILPLPNYHNILNLLVNINQFYSSRQKYIWKGWCIYDEDR